MVEAPEGEEGLHSPGRSLDGGLGSSPSQNKRYLDDSGEKERIKDSLRKLGEDTFTTRSGADIKRLKGKSYDLYRLRVGEHRFERFVEDGVVWDQRAFRRGKGYLIIP